MTTKNQNIIVYEAEDKTITISVTDTAGGSPVALTGATEITWRVTTGAVSETALIEKTLTGGSISLTDDAGTDDQIVITLDSSDTEDLASHNLYHECRVIDANSKNHVVAVGRFEVLSSSTG